MDKVEKIKQEIERLDEKYRELRVSGTMQQAKEADLVVHVLLQISNFIDSLSEEPNMKNEMTDYTKSNEEKAQEIAAKDVCCVWNRGCPNIKYGAIEMAEWKDDKFYTLLACVKFSLEKSGINGVDEFINKIKKHWEE